MDKFFERFKPKNNNNNNNNNNKGGNLLGNFKIPGLNINNNTFQGEGKSLGGTEPGKVIPIELKEAGPLGIKVEKRPNSQGTVIVNMVVENSQAARAGIQRGDILCFAGSNGREEILYDMFLELAKSNQRPLCFEVRRIKTTTPTAAATAAVAATPAVASADDYARRQAVIAAAEAREKANKQKLKPIKRTFEPTPTAVMESATNDVTDTGPKSEAARKAIEEAKLNEAKTAAQLGYNPYETNKVTSGQARNATTTVQHGALTAATNADGTVSIPVVAPPRDVVGAAAPDRNGPPPSEHFERAYETVVTSNDHAAVVESFNIMRKLLVNATNKGQNTDDEVAAAKFRRVRLGNPKIKSALVDVEGAIDLMLSAGFQLAEEGGESLLVYPPGDKGPAWLQTGLDQMERYENS